MLCQVVEVTAIWKTKRMEAFTELHTEALGGPTAALVCIENAIDDSSAGKKP
jgi:hypothetical protein